MNRWRHAEKIYGKGLPKAIKRDAMVQVRVAHIIESVDVSHTLWFHCHRGTICSERLKKVIESIEEVEVSCA